MDKGLESAGRGNMRLLITPSSVLLPQALTAWHSARCSSIPGPSGQRAAMQGLVVPGSAAASTGQSRALFLCCWLQTTRILCMKRTVASSSNPKRLLLCSLSLRCSVLFCFVFFFPFSGIGVSYFNIYLSKPRTDHSGSPGACPLRNQFSLLSFGSQPWSSHPPPQLSY